MSKYLITGGAGFIGFQLASHLSKIKSNKVYIFDNFTRGNEDVDFVNLLKKDNVFLIDRDITSPSSFNDLNDFDFIYHFAAINGTNNFYSIPDDVIKVGVIGTINILDWFKNQNRGKLIFSSSSETYAGAEKLLGSKFPIPTDETIPLVINDPKNIRWSYGGSKIIGEVLMYSYMKKYGLNSQLGLIRFHNIYGPRMGFDHVIPQFIERIINKENPFNIYGATATRAFCFIDDAINALELIMNNEKSMGDVFNIGNDKEEIQIVDLSKKLFNVANYQVDTKIQNAPKGSVDRRCPDISKIKKLGFEPSVSLDEGLIKTLKWYKNYYKNK